MLEKIKKFFKKYVVFVSIAFVILILFALILALLLQDKETDENGDDITDVTPIEDPSESPIIRQPLGYHKNYEIGFTDVVSNRLTQKEGKYYGFKIKDINHLNWVENFVERIGKDNLPYTKEEPTSEAVSHYWEGNNESIFYNENRDFLVLRFNTPIYIPNVNFNPRDEFSIGESLSNMAEVYFSANFEYEVNEVSRIGNDYRVEYSRVLEGQPVYIDQPREYLLLTPDGRLKEGLFLLVEFEKYTGMKFLLIPIADLKTNISLMEYPKNVEFKNLNPEVEDEFYPYGYIAFTNPFTQEGIIEVTEVELVYYYAGLSQEIIVPTFLFKGSGLLDVEGSLEEADFTILANAIDPEYVYIHPQSHFDTLEGLE